MRHTRNFGGFVGGFLAVLFLVLAVGCVGNYKPPENAQQAINEAKVILVASKEMIADHVANGVLTPDEAQAKLDKTRSLEADLRKAEDLLTEGLDVEAWNKADLVRSLINSLHRELRARQ